MSKKRMLGGWSTSLCISPWYQTFAFQGRQKWKVSLGLSLLIFSKTVILPFYNNFRRPFLYCLTFPLASSFSPWCGPLPRRTWSSPESPRARPPPACTSWAPRTLPDPVSICSFWGMTSMGVRRRGFVWKNRCSPYAWLACSSALLQKKAKDKGWSLRQLTQNFFGALGAYPHHFKI